MPGNSQMSKYEKPKVMSQTGRYISTAALIAISPFLSTKSIAADLKCTQTPTCTQLGYSKSSDACPSGNWIYCPFDTSYKKCVRIGGVDCSAYTLTACPDTAKSCSMCGIGTNIYYKIEACKSGFHLSENSCNKYKTCEDYGYVSSDPSKACQYCPSLEILTDDEQTLSCYDAEACYWDQNCLDAKATCEDYGYLSQSPEQNSCEICTSIDVNVSETRTLKCFTNECTIDDQCNEQRCKTLYGHLNIERCDNTCRYCDCSTVKIEEDPTCNGYIQECFCASWG